MRYCFLARRSEKAPHKICIAFILLSAFFSNCKNLPSPPPCNCGKESAKDVATDSTAIPEDLFDEILAYDYDTTQWTELTSIQGVTLDIRYATPYNFTKQPIYNCERCFLRPGVAEKVLQLNALAEEQRGWHFKIFDCYRPRPAQQRLWDIHPNATHVMHPSKGSMHNRGAAVDLTLVDATGTEVDMGTDFDSFERKARHDFQELPQEILENRIYLKNLMESVGFKSIKSEWWHYSFSGLGSALSEWEWECPD